MKIDLPDGVRWIAADSPEIEKHNAIEEELREFYYAIIHRENNGVTFEQAAKAVEVAHRIMEQITEYEV
jgi:predicted dehydrogenase